MTEQETMNGIADLMQFHFHFNKKDGQWYAGCRLFPLLSTSADDPEDAVSDLLDEVNSILEEMNEEELALLVIEQERPILRLLPPEDPDEKSLDRHQ